VGTLRPPPEGVTAIDPVNAPLGSTVTVTSAPTTPEDADRLRAYAVAAPGPPPPVPEPSMAVYAAGGGSISPAELDPANVTPPAEGDHANDWGTAEAAKTNGCGVARPPPEGVRVIVPVSGPLGRTVATTAVPAAPEELDSEIAYAVAVAGVEPPPESPSGSVSGWTRRRLSDDASAPPEAGISNPRSVYGPSATPSGIVSR
jgi:hypothetical protein